MLGSSQGGLLQPIQQQTWSLLWKDENATEKTNTMFGLQPYSNPLEGTMYFVNDWDTVTDLIARSKVDYDSPDKMEGGSPYEQVFQYKSTLIALYSIPEDTRFPHILTLFSRELENRVEDPSGWIFAKGGPVYVAYRPFAPGEWKSIDWTGLLKGGAGGFFSTNFAEFAEGSEFYFSESLNNGYIVQIAPVSEYSSMKAFIDDINQLPLEFSMEPNPSVTFTGLDGATLSATYGEAPAVDGEVVNYQDWKLFDGPFSQAEKASESVEIIYGNETYSLDFKNGTSSTTLSSN